MPIRRRSDDYEKREVEMTENDAVMPDGPHPIEQKVKASTATAAISTVVVGIVGHYIFRGTEVPEWLVVAIEALIVMAATWYAGWQAKHTYRPDLPGRLDNQGRRIVP